MGPLHDIAMNEKFASYAHPNVLVDQAWIRAHLDDSDIRIVESNEDILLYDTGHIPNAVHIDWRRDLHFQTNTTIDTLDYSGSGWNAGSAMCSFFSRSRILSPM